MVPEEAADVTWKFHPVLGSLRALWVKARASIAAGPLPAAGSLPPAPFPPAAPALNASSLLSLGVPQQRLNTAERDKLKRAFEKSYSGVVLAPSTLPGLSFLQCAQSQCASKSWEWLCWKRVLSEENVGQIKDRKRGSQPLEVADLLAHAAGLVHDELDIDLGGSAYRVEKLLTVRSHAYCMCGAGHLSSWGLYTQAFMALYTIH